MEGESGLHPGDAAQGVGLSSVKPLKSDEHLARHALASMSRDLAAVAYRSRGQFEEAQFPFSDR